MNKTDVNNTLSLAGKDLISILIRKNTKISKGNKDVIKTEQGKKGTNSYFLLQIKRVYRQITGTYRSLADAISNKQKKSNQLTYSTP